MKLLAVSKFSWRSHVYQPGEIFDAEDIIANRMVKDGFAEKTQVLPDPDESAVLKSGFKAEPNTRAGDSGASAAVLTKSKSKKK